MAEASVALCKDHCVVCFSEVRRLHCFSSLQSKWENIKEHYEVILGKVIDADIHKIKICGVCAKKCSEFVEYQEEKKVKLCVSFGSECISVTSTVEDRTVPFNLTFGIFSFIISLPYDQVKSADGSIVCLKTSEGNIKIKVCLEEEATDDFFNFVKNFMQWYFVIININDAIKEGDYKRTNIALKVMMPFFYSHSPLSKYMVECIDYILKTKIMLSPQLSLRVKAASFVNTRGGRGKNMAADMLKENQVKVLKDLIRGLGSNKTEKAIVTISKAAPVIKCIVENFDSAVNLNQIKTTHKKREMIGYINMIVKFLKTSMFGRKHLEDY